MASSYKTPGVFVEEITKFPPSVAEVDTAIPAFVGYTEKAKRFVDDDLLKIPTRIKSLLEYEQFFGIGPSYGSIKVQLTSGNLVDESKTTVNNSIYNLYESLRLYFDNGGGVCYVCSAGKYNTGDNDAARATAITNGLAEIKKFDEPTLLLFPDAVNIKDGGLVDWDKLSGIQQAALKQCNDLGDRFAVLDVGEDSNRTIEEEIESFRSSIGMNYLKYGAAYTPYLKTIYEKSFKLRDIMKNLFDASNASIELKSLFSDSDVDTTGVTIKSKLDNFQTLYKDNDNLNSRLALFSGKTVNDTFDINLLENTFQSFVNSFKGANSNNSGDAARLSALKSAFEFVFETFAQLEGMVTNHAESDFTNAAGPIAGKPIRVRVISNASLKSSVKSLLSTNLKKSLQTLRNLDHEAYRIGSPEISNTASDKPTVNGVPDMYSIFTTSQWQPAAAADANLISGANLTQKGTAAINQLTSIFQTAKSGLTSALNSGLSFEDVTEKALIADLPIYNSIVKVLNSKVNTIPPSGAIAGIYAAVDRDRGVWKAPANVTINSVSDVSTLIDDTTQEGLNIDSNAGKSVNAIRAFYGKGITVWGARTLAGNDNEWRYVPVRRLFNFAEESCKKSTAWCVFEPNDANTWARIRSQIDNFLNNLWRSGALAGAKPDHAYYVNCGLGITMTTQDILEGRLIVEIGLAAVRPAEFVILKFSHKLQQS